MAGWDVLNEEDGSGTLLRTRFGGLAIAAGSSAATGTWAYYFTDALGVNPVEAPPQADLWDQDGDRIGKYEYTPFGGKYADSGNDVTRKYTGHDWDSEARLYSTAYRFYSPDSNRWLTRDPLGMVDGPNVYAYVVNNPVTMWDAFGQQTAVQTSGAAGIAVSLNAAIRSVMLTAMLLSMHLGWFGAHVVPNPSSQDDDQPNPECV